MKIIREAGELKTAGRKVCAAIGFFDGVHLGHQQILRETIADARKLEGLSLAVTFDRHPNTVVAPERVPPLIYTLERKLRAIESLGCDALLLIHFDRTFSEQSGEEFIRKLAADLSQLQSLCVGSAFVFGRRGAGNVTLLKTLGEELKFSVHGMSEISLDGGSVSSTRVREAISAGNFDAASQMLGRAYTLAGKVVRGDQVGRQIGFPTANLGVNGLVLPPFGVYAVHALVGERTYRAVANIGLRPTLNSPVPQLRVEAHFLDFQGDLYGREVELSFVDKLRDEMKFPSLPALHAQISRDIVEARKRF